MKLVKKEKTNNRIQFFLLLLPIICILSGCGDGTGAVSASGNETAVASVQVYYLEAGSGRELSAPLRLSDSPALEVAAAEQQIAIDGYVYESASAETVRANAGESQTLILYYKSAGSSSAVSAPVTVLTVRHLDIQTKKQLLQSEIVTGAAEMKADGGAYKKSIAGYTYLQSDPAGGLQLKAGSTGTLTLYYQKQSAASAASSKTSSAAQSSAVSTETSTAVSSTASTAVKGATVTVRFLPEGGGDPLMAPVVLKSASGSLTVKISEQVKTITGYTYLSSDPSADFTVSAGQTRDLILTYKKKAPAAPVTALYPSAPGTVMINAAKGWVDISNTSQGYVTAKFMGDPAKKAKLQIALGSRSNYYDLDSNGKTEVYPLQWGNGTYTFKIFEQKSGTEYYSVLSGSASVAVENEFLPFLYPNQYVNYTADYATVAKAAELCAGASDDFDRLKAVFDYVTANIKYDYDKAASVQSGYMPNVDTILAAKKGICFDYASLTAAMLRSQGIPTRLVVGYVAPNSVNHAWNEVYIQGKGWVTAKIYIESKTWKLMDLTFLAAGVNNSEITAFVGNGSNYTKQEIF